LEGATPFEVAGKGSYITPQTKRKVGDGDLGRSILRTLRSGTGGGTSIDAVEILVHYQKEKQRLGAVFRKPKIQKKAMGPWRKKSDRPRRVGMLQHSMEVRDDR